jgi:hypothetical protein
MGIKKYLYIGGSLDGRHLPASASLENEEETYRQWAPIAYAKIEAYIEQNLTGLEVIELLIKGYKPKGKR